ncbi:MAG: hypothetical protein AAF845_10410 [Bacteroidota bacterium]
MRAPLLALAPLLFGGCLADAAPEDDDDSQLLVGTFEEVTGADHLRAPLTNGRAESITSSIRGGYDGYGETVNVLFYDVAARESRWLLPDTDRVILSTEAVRDSGRVRAFVYQIVEADTDGDGRLGADDARTIALSDPTGRRLVRVVEGAERLRQVRRLGDDTVLILYDAASTVGAVEVGLDSLEVEAEVTMPPPPRPADPEAGA